MSLHKTLTIAAGFVVAATIAANAQPQYPAYFSHQPPVPPPPAWYYNPYTSGLGPCPQHFPGDPPCGATIDPSYGQPSFWTRRY